MMLVCADAARMNKDVPADLPEPDDGGSFPWLDEMQARGVRLQGDRLQPPSAAATVRMRDGEMLVTDGPFAETKEAIAGFDILECASLQEAIEVAAKHPVAEFGAIEVRPFWYI
jgi:hypothetical protein